MTVPNNAEADRLRKSYLDLVRKAVTNYLYLGGEGAFARFSSVPFYDLAESRWSIAPESRPLTLLHERQLELIERQLLRLEDEGVSGDLLEAGVWRGGAVIYMRALLEAYAIEQRNVIAADSFAGIPISERFRHDDVNQWRDRWVAGIDEVRHAFARFSLLDERVELIEGYFADTLPRLSERSFAMIRLDSDSFESVETSLQHVYPRLAKGGVVIIDDWHLIGCKLAVGSYRDRHGIRGEIMTTAGNAWWIKQEELGIPL